jgi:transposase
MWTTENRAKYDRSALRYPSDLTDTEWLLIAPLIPPAKRGGNKRTVDEREVVNGVMYILSTGRQWAALPTDLPPRSTVNDYWQAPPRKGRKSAGLNTKATCSSSALDSGVPIQGGSTATRRATMRARRSKARNAVCHEHTDRKRRCGAV